MSLHRKLILASCSILILAACIISVISTVSMQKQVLSDLRNTMSSYGESGASRVSAWLASKQRVVASLKEAVEAHSSNDDYIIQALNQAQTAGDLISVLYGVDNGDAYRTNGKNTKDGYDPRTRDWYQASERQGGASISEPFMGSTSKSLIFSLSDQVIVDGKMKGVVSGNVSLSGVNDVVASLKIPGQGYAFVISDSGEFISYPDESYNSKLLSSLDSNITQETINKNITSQDIVDVSVNNTEYMMSSVRIKGTNWSLVSLGNKKVLMAPISNLITYQVTIALVLIVLSIIVLSLLIRFLLADLVLVSNALEDIAQGHGDLTVKIETKSTDEVGKLAQNFNNFVFKLRDIIKSIDGLSNVLSDQSKASAASVEQSTRRINIQQNEIVSVAAAVEEITTATQEIAGNAEQTAQRANDTVAISGTGQNLANTSLTSINQLAQEVSLASQVIAELSEQGDKINSIVSTISGIAEQTNLLALNAAIEAARAGEQGRGFAVVADEVRVLSQRTHSSTEEISSMISMLQSTTSKAVKVMDLCHTLASTSVNDTEKSGNSFAEIASAIDMIDNMTAQIATAAEEQTSVTAEIARNTQAIRDVSSELQEEMDHGLEQAHNLKKLAESLREQVQKFKL
ncbi:methyl-accepting chemotaxis protein [Marinomonas sp. UCMA 3892]|uniref:methyl-accepting chemotaxis protein n=1 Tax=unclassified Marinomonas TaxID=196814 RepID=UPI00146A8DEB|nr:methyl-accepting chemotaxis protein [Marinomonas sp. UCMA 3892]NLU99453.1 methyl-accepting chemotaxis protein [Marinomonas sp. UCMA 3892]